MNNNSAENAIPEDNKPSGFTEPFEAIDMARVALDSANVGIWIMDGYSGEVDQ
ncbi:hypothetical protein [Mucilaginibacter sp. FT3.2]|uniref:hypothetical protein n=1 Tax=Mucilaginibacter sp. FT3.2 TaxID=2723090 RepID=UPI001608E411|nr:hypothetical protein [Mucilaginibacter sp. FT3.2]MBB6235343.1 hypothetical protein [Mucilaginibacter sp. FT3.2]